MSIFASDTKKDWKQPAEGLAQAVCVDVVDLGMVKTEWGEKHKVRVVWQVEEINPDTGKRFTVRRDFGLTLSQKSVLRPTLEAWRGRKFTPEELAGFDVERLVGANCQIQVAHNISDEGSIYANVQAVVPLGKGMGKIAGEEYIRVKDRPKAQGNAPEEAANAATDQDIPF